MKAALHSFEPSRGIVSPDGAEIQSQRREFRDLLLASRNEAIGVVRDWWEAWFRGDIEALTALTCERYVEFGVDGEVMVTGKTALVEQARNRNGTLRISEWAIVKPEVRHLEDASICRYRFRVVGSLHHNPVRKEGLVADVLVKVGDTWKLVAHHGVFPNVLDRKIAGTRARHEPA
jgi:ketosteroid isomerase-like protein